MGSTSRKGRATINPTAPEALGICDRCGALYNLRRLKFQFEWAGTGMINKQVRVCPTCYDIPQEQLRAFTLPPDPPPVLGARVEPFDIDEVSAYTLRAVIGKPNMFQAGSGLECSVFAGVNPEMIATLLGTADMTAAVVLGKLLAATISDTADMTAAAVLGKLLAATISDTGTVTADLAAGVLVTRVYLAADIDGGQITIPSDYTSTGAVWHAVGGSPASTNPGTTDSGGGVGGGAYAANNTGLVFTPGAEVAAQIGTGDVWVSNTGSTPTTTGQGVLAKGGTTNSGSTGGAGGASGSCVGTSANSGGAGGNGSISNTASGGGGGAAGPNGIGRNGGAVNGLTLGGGGGGANGGSAGGFGTGSTGGAGGNNRLGTGGGAGGTSANGTAGTAGGGGGGSGGIDAGLGGAGSMDGIWTDTSSGPNNGLTVGPGSGGGGSGKDALGAQGGLYGGGAGGTGEDAVGTTAGREGVLVVQYYSSGVVPDRLLQEDDSLLLLESLDDPVYLDTWQDDVTDAATLDGTEYLAMAQDGVTVKISLAALIIALRGGQ